MNESAAALMGAAVPVVAAYALGSIMRVQQESSVLRFAFGSCLLCLLLFALMVSHVATPLAILLVCGVPVAFAIVSRRLAFHLSWQKPPLVPGILIGLYICLYLLSALSPELQTDALNYHLQPAIEAQKHSGFTSEINFYNRLPQAAELLYIPAYQIGGAKACRLVHMIFLLATLPLILSLTEILSLPRAVGWAGACLYFLSPVVGTAGTSAMNDGMLVFFCLSVAVSASNFWRSPSNLVALQSGWLAGMCYAVKMTGGIAIPFGLAIVVAKNHERLRAAVLFLAGVMIVAGPWLVRNWMEAGNPFAPFFNSLFPSPHFYTYVEDGLNTDLRNYGISFPRRFAEVLTGYRLQGLIGPVFVLTPLALLFIHRRSMQLLLGSALLFSTAWWLNAGARFLMPALPFVSLAISSFLPRRIAPVVLAFHAVLSWPPVVDFMHVYNWRIRDYTLQPSDEYLRKQSWDYRVAKVIERHTKSEARILDLMGLHLAFIDRRVIGPWQSAEGFQARNALELTQKLDRDTLYEVRCTFPEQVVQSVEIRQTAASPTPFSITEIGLWSGLKPVVPGRGWSVDGSINRWDVPLLFDANVISRWSTWRMKQPGDLVSINFGTPERLSRVTLLAPASDSSADLTFALKLPNGSTVAFPSTKHQAPELNLRVHTIDYLRKMGIEYILVSTLDDGLSVLGRELVAHSEAWNLKKVAQYEWVHLLEIPSDRN